MISKTNFRNILFVSRSWHVTQATHKRELSRSEPNRTYLRLLLRTSYDMRACLLHVHFDITHTVDGRNSANQLKLRIYHYLQGFIHPRWWSRRISEPSTVCTWIPSCRCLHWSNRFHLSRECQAICSWISRTFEDNSKSQILDVAMSCANQNGNLQYAGGFKCHPFCRGSNNANQ